MAAKKSEKERLRQRAEKLISKKFKGVVESRDRDIKSLTHDLRVHQVELEMQNEELRRAQGEIEESRLKYIDLYDFAPVGYFTFTKTGEIVEANLTGARLLGIERGKLVHRLFSTFVEDEFRALFRDHRLKVLKNQERDRCELKLIKKDGKSFYASLESIPAPSGEKDRIRSAVSNIDELRKAQDKAQRRTAELAEINEALKVEVAERQEAEKQLRYLSNQFVTAQENERKRVASELHDGLQQYLTGIKFKVESFLQDVRSSGIRAETKKLEDVIPIIQESVREIRRIHTNLRPPILDDLGILTTISWFCREYEATHKRIQVEKQIHIQESEIPDPLKMAVYRIMQEGMTNIAKHSGASLVRLSFRKADGRIELSIQDNGQGFDIQGTLSVEKGIRGMGLGSMQERAEHSGGSFLIDSKEGKGTVLRVTWKV